MFASLCQLWDWRDFSESRLLSEPERGVISRLCRSMEKVTSSQTYWKLQAALAPLARELPLAITCMSLRNYGSAVVGFVDIGPLHCFSLIIVIVTSCIQTQQSRSLTTQPYKLLLATYH